MSGIHQMKQLLALKCSSSQDTQEEINQRMEQVVGEATCEFNQITSPIMPTLMSLFRPISC